MIRAIITGQELKLASTPYIVSDTIDYITADFRFSGDWAGLEKHAIFEMGGDTYDVTLIDDAIAADKHLNLTTGTWTMSVVGVEIEDAEIVKRITTYPVAIGVLNSGSTSGEPFPPAVGSEIYLKLNQTTEQEIVNGVPKLAADRVIDEDHHLTDKKYVDDGLGAIHTHANKPALDLVSGTNTGDQVLPTRDSLGLDTNDTVTFANLSGTNTGDQDLTALATKASTMRLLISRTIAAGEAVSAITWTQDDAGNALALIDADIRIHIPANSIGVGNVGRIYLRFNEYSTNGDYYTGSSFLTAIYAIYYSATYGKGHVLIRKNPNGFCGESSYARYDGTTLSPIVSACGTTFDAETISNLCLCIQGITYFPAGSSIKIYGRTV